MFGTWHHAQGGKGWTIYFVESGSPTLSDMLERLRADFGEDFSKLEVRNTPVSLTPGPGAITVRRRP